MPLSDVLCWPSVAGARRSPGSPDITQFMVGSGLEVLPELTGGFHPDIVARTSASGSDRCQFPRRLTCACYRSEPANGIPSDIRRAIDGDVTMKDRRKLKRPRVILSTRLRREDSEFSRVESYSPSSALIRRWSRMFLRIRCQAAALASMPDAPRSGPRSAHSNRIGSPCPRHVRSSGRHPDTGTSLECTEFPGTFWSARSSGARSEPAVAAVVSAKRR